MNRPLSNPFEQRLLAKRQALLQLIAEQRGGKMSRAEVASDHFGHTEDYRAQINTERELEFAISEQETAELITIDNALQRIKAGTYGLCVDCKAEIPTDRLLAVPEAALCLCCQDKLEHRQADLRVSRILFNRGEF